MGIDTDGSSDLTNSNTPDVVREILEIYQGNDNIMVGYHLRNGVVMSTDDIAIGNLPDRLYYANSYVNTYLQSILEAPLPKVGTNHLKIAYEMNQSEINEQEELHIKQIFWNRLIANGLVKIMIT